MPLVATSASEQRSMRKREERLDELRRVIHKALKRGEAAKIEPLMIQRFAEISLSVIHEKLHPVIPFSQAAQPDGSIKRIRIDYNGAHGVAKRFVAMTELVTPNKRLRKGLIGDVSTLASDHIGALIDYLAKPVGGDGLIRLNASQLNKLLIAIAPTELSSAFTTPRLRAFHDSLMEGADLAPEHWNEVMVDFSEIVYGNKPWRVALQQKQTGFEPKPGERRLLGRTSETTRSVQDASPEKTVLIKESKISRAKPAPANVSIHALWAKLTTAASRVKTRAGLVNLISAIHPSKRYLGAVAIALSMRKARRDRLVSNREVTDTLYGLFKDAKKNPDRAYEALRLYAPLIKDRVSELPISKSQIKKYRDHARTAGWAEVEAMVSLWGRSIPEIAGKLHDSPDTRPSSVLLKVEQPPFQKTEFKQTATHPVYMTTQATIFQNPSAASVTKHTRKVWMSGFRPRVRREEQGPLAF